MSKLQLEVQFVGACGLLEACIRFTACFDQGHSALFTVPTLGAWQDYVTNI